MQSKFSKYLTCFRKNFNTQITRLAMIEKWKSIWNKKLKVGTFLYIFDILDHFLSWAKLSVYGSDNNSLAFSQISKI